ncbi:MAG: filamentous hemagglutinin N-terminal domain-containing protein [Stigonema ocellatum SAG 48.90 = DSM 106950]|nr:filamentous hemagglutinin N-terminal domain-containing protein [Stigonema ocellatum SAG 48.90 = DSM 106950]
MCYIFILILLRKQQMEYIYFNKFLLLFIAIFLLLETPLKVLAQTRIYPDGTLPTNVNNVGGGVYEITGGVRPNNNANLFHSLKDFSIEFGDTARFVHEQGIQNIITRITGGSPSQINGTIQTLINGTKDIGNANLFIINPSGIIFGANAKLDIGGSFIGSTADSIKFADGTEFSAIKPVANPILTVSVPLGLQYGSNPNSTIRVNGLGNNLILNDDSSLDRTNRPNGLHYETPNGQTLALVGGHVMLDGGNVTLPQGKVELWSVNNGLVSLVNRNGQLQLEPGQGINYGNIELVNAASVDTSGNGGGSIQVRGGNVTLKDGSVIVTDTLGNGAGGKLNVSASELLTVKGFVLNPNNQVFSGLLADVAPGATVHGSNVVIQTKNLQVTDGGQISSGTFGAGNAGELRVNATNVQVSGISPFGPSGFFAPVALGATGSGGNLTIETESLQVAEGAQIVTNTFGFGTAGNLNINAQDIEVRGGTQMGPSLLGSTVFRIPGIPEPIATFLGAGTGKGGNLKIQTGSLRVADGAQIAASTSGSGNAGNLEVKADLVELVGFNQGGRSGLFANAIQKDGNGGDIMLTTHQLTIRDGATISVSNFQSQGTVPPGKGAAGNIQINAPVLLIQDQGTITADTNAGDKGNITIQSQNFQIRQGSQLSTNARNSGDGGNITITTDTLLASENSNITANARQGFGGRVVVNAKGIFTPESDITASSELGPAFNGTVKLNTPDVDPSQGLVQLPENFTDRSRQIANGCGATQQNRFVVSGRGGLPENPTQTLRGQTVWTDVRDLSGKLGNAKATSSNYQPKSNGQQIVEAQEFMMSADGTVHLVAAMAQATPPIPRQAAPQYCKG